MMRLKGYVSHDIPRDWQVTSAGEKEQIECGKGGVRAELFWVHERLAYWISAKPGSTLYTI